MTTIQFFDTFDRTKHLIEELCLQYGFKNEWEKIFVYRKWRRQLQIERVLNDIWFHMPDKVNIANSTPGWCELINLIEK